MAESYLPKVTNVPEMGPGANQPVHSEQKSKARTIHGLAAELKNEIRADRIRQAERQRNGL